MRTRIAGELQIGTAVVYRGLATTRLPSRRQLRHDEGHREHRRFDLRGRTCALGVGVRIVDAAAEPGTTSRALVIHARTLEFYRQMGLAEALLQDGLRLVRPDEHVAVVDSGQNPAALAPYMAAIRARKAGTRVQPKRV